MKKKQQSNLPKQVLDTARTCYSLSTLLPDDYVFENDKDVLKENNKNNIKDNSKDIKDNNNKKKIDKVDKIDKFKKVTVSAEDANLFIPPTSNQIVLNLSNSSNISNVTIYDETVYIELGYNFPYRYDFDPKSSSYLIKTLVSKSKHIFYITKFQQYEASLSNQIKSLQYESEKHLAVSNYLSFLGSDIVLNKILKYEVKDDESYLEYNLSFLKDLNNKINEIKQRDITIKFNINNDAFICMSKQDESIITEGSVSINWFPKLFSLAIREETSLELEARIKLIEEDKKKRKVLEKNPVPNLPKKVLDITSSKIILEPHIPTLFNTIASCLQFALDGDVRDINTNERIFDKLGPTTKIIPSDEGLLNLKKYYYLGGVGAGECLDDWSKLLAEGKCEPKPIFIPLIGDEIAKKASYCFSLNGEIAKRLGKDAGGLGGNETDRGKEFKTNENEASVKNNNKSNDKNLQKGNEKVIKANIEKKSDLKDKKKRDPIQQSPTDTFTMKLFFMGEYRSITIDYYFPTNEYDQWVFPVTDKKEIWPALVIKALITLFNCSNDLHLMSWISKSSTTISNEGIKFNEAFMFYSLFGYIPLQRELDNLNDDVISEIHSEVNTILKLKYLLIKKKYGSIKKLMHKPMNLYVEIVAKSKKNKESVVLTPNNKTTSYSYDAYGKMTRNMKKRMTLSLNPHLRLSSVNVNPISVVQSHMNEMDQLLEAHLDQLKEKSQMVLVNVFYSTCDYFNNKEFNMDRLKPLDFSDFHELIHSSKKNYKTLTKTEKKEYLDFLISLKLSLKKQKQDRINMLLSKGEQYSLVKVIDNYKLPEHSLLPRDKENSFDQDDKNKVIVNLNDQRDKTISNVEINQAQLCLKNGWTFPRKEFLLTIYSDDKNKKQMQLSEFLTLIEY